MHGENGESQQIARKQVNYPPACTEQAAAIELLRPRIAEEEINFL